MKKTCALLLSAAVVASAIGLTACGGKRELVYPDEGYANADSDSWTQLAEDAEELTVNWFVNYASFGNAASKGTLVAEKIYEKTKCRINFITPVDDSGAQLSTMIAGNKLPDVVTVGASSEESAQLATEGYAYPVQELAKRYAPSLINRLDGDIASFFKMSDGNIYGLPNHFYTTDDMDAYAKQEGKNLASNGAMLVREDYLDWYVSRYPEENITTASGFLKMCKAVKQAFNLSDTNPTFMLDSFSSTGSVGVMWLMEYFAVPKEDKNGDLLLEYEQENYKDALLWLNELYREKLITSGNLSAQAGTLAAYLQQGMPFAFLGSPQMYTNSFANAAKSGINYVPVVITNDKGDAPLLRDLSGSGWQYSMITNNCAHPDRVIKLFDYLYSDEGQSLFFGVEGETFDYTVQPGGTADGKTYKYGKIAWDPEVEKDIINGDTSAYGFMYFNMFVNPMYPRLASPDGAVLNSYNDYIDYNLKIAISDYTYSVRGFEYVRDPSDARYKDIFVKSNNISAEWARYIPQIISAKTKEDAETIYSATVASAKRLGSADVYAFDNETFKAYKEKIGITYAWPANDPAYDYANRKVTNIRGNVSYNLVIPEKYIK